MARGAKSTFIITIHSAFECCHNPIMGYSPKFIFFFKIKIKNNNKGCQRRESRPGSQVAIFGGNSRPNCAPLCPKIEKKNTNLRLN